MTPYSARLVIHRSGTDSDADAVTTPDHPYQARWVELDGQMSKAFGLKPPLTSEDAADLRWYLEKYHEFVGDGTQARAHKIEAKLEPWGRALFDAAFGTVEGTHVYRNLLDAEKEGRPVLVTVLALVGNAVDVDVDADRPDIQGVVHAVAVAVVDNTCTKRVIEDVRLHDPLHDGMDAQVGEGLREEKVH